MTLDRSRARRVYEFVSQHIASIEELEILLLLWRSRTRWWHAADVADDLEITVAVARRRLEQLSGRFLEVRVTGDVCFRFAPGHREREERVADVAAAYRESRMEIVGFILSGRSARHFADAFRLKRGDE